MSDEWLNINFATGHHGNGSRIAVGIAENATDVHLYIVMKAISGSSDHDERPLVLQH